jgi:hypothetical protein
MAQLVKLGAAANPLLHDHVFQGAKPVTVVGITQVRIAMLLSIGDGVTQSGSPLLPGENTLFVH